MKLLDEKALATELGVTRWVVRQWKRKHSLPHIRVGRRVYYQMQAVERWLERAREGEVAT